MAEMTGKNAKKHRFFRISAAVLIILFVMLSVMSLPLKVQTYEIHTAKVSRPFRIVQISDLHNNRYGKDMSELKALLDDAAPDAVALTGDIYDDRGNNENTREFVKYAAEHYRCVYVAGNHELRSGKWDEFAAEAQGFGVTVLEAGCEDFGEVRIFGVETPQMIRNALDGYTEDGGYNVLLSHYPEEFELYDSFSEPDLVLCGHAHGGQWRLPFCQNGLFAPEQGIFPKYSGGRFDSDDMTMIVSRGLSRTSPPFPRINNNPEFVIIDIIGITP